MNFLERMVCLVQQYAAAGVEIVSTNPIEVEGPDEVVDRFIEVFRWLRRSCEENGKPGLPDKAICRLRGRPKSCRLGHIDWETAFPQEWAFTIHEQNLLACRLGRKVWVPTEPSLSGRLECIRPGWCFVTPSGETIDNVGPVVEFLQRTDGAVRVSSLRVELSPDLPKRLASAGETSSLDEVERVREEIATRNKFRRPKKAQREINSASDWHGLEVAQ